MNNQDKQSLLKAIRYNNNQPVVKPAPAAAPVSADKYSSVSKYAVAPKIPMPKTMPSPPPNSAPVPKAQKPEEIKIDFKPVSEVRETRRYVPVTAQESMVTQERLQEAIIWSEILGKPLSKRRKRR